MVSFFACCLVRGGIGVFEICWWECKLLVFFMIILMDLEIKFFFGMGGIICNVYVYFEIVIWWLVGRY